MGARNIGGALGGGDGAAGWPQWPARAVYIYSYHSLLGLVKSNFTIFFRKIDFFRVGLGLAPLCIAMPRHARQGQGMHRGATVRFPLDGDKSIWAMLAIPGIEQFVQAVGPPQTIRLRQPPSFVFEFS
jgi:hypothetical protein